MSQTIGPFGNPWTTTHTDQRTFAEVVSGEQKTTPSLPSPIDWVGKVDEAYESESSQEFKIESLLDTWDTTPVETTAPFPVNISKPVNSISQLIKAEPAEIKTEEKSQEAAMKKKTEKFLNSYTLFYRYMNQSPYKVSLSQFDCLPHELGSISLESWEFLSDVSYCFQTDQRLKSFVKEFNRDQPYLYNFISQQRSAASKNRYTDILPWNHTLVRLKHAPFGSYINANHISLGDRKFIATQGPTDTTFDDFLQMLAENGAKAIATAVMPKESDRDKCYNYWNGAPEKTIFQEVEKKHPQEIIERELSFLPYGPNPDVAEPLKTVTQLHFQNWPDQGIPNMDLFIKYLNLLDSYGLEEPLVVHCSAGIGRTGVVMACLFIMDEIKRQCQNNVPVEEIQLNIPQTVMSLRLQRHPDMVQTYEQYDFIIQVAKELILRSSTYAKRSRSKSPASTAPIHAH